ncbi:hypothetical protein NHH03_23355 [Stieleria sp. TO1_6]|uniref:hypothetical protein n=1 Tax=Stieleria tagensis TaxID=2956795 RepID=UPI00209AFFFF|nr:hypothetical protein [Stieleria tagensis]MCO8124696.1 hypothetical protein [Stieleria tagensis]
MIRSFTILLAAALGAHCALDCSTADAQLFSGKRLSRLRDNLIGAPAISRPPTADRTPSRYRSQVPAPSMGLSIGIGSYPYYGYPPPGSFNPYRFDSYTHDPYRLGRFDAPDLLNDPYFRERTRYDSRYPGRYRSPLVLRSTVPAPDVVPSSLPPLHRPSYSVPAPLSYGSSVSEDYVNSASDDRTARLQLASDRLARSLADRADGDAWLQFLAPGDVPGLVERQDWNGLSDLLSHYNGITNNPDLTSIVTAAGFAETRVLMEQLVRRHTDSGIDQTPSYEVPSYQTPSQRVDQLLNESNRLLPDERADQDVPMDQQPELELPEVEDLPSPLPSLELDSPRTASEEI